MTQAAQLREPFPQSLLKEISKGGTKLTYVPVSEVVARLNNVLDDFSVVDSNAWRDATNPEWVIGRVELSATIDGHKRTTVGLGGVKIKELRDGKGIVDLGDEFKGAASDALKKAAQAWGVGLGLARGDKAEAEDNARNLGYKSAEHRTETIADIATRWNHLIETGADLTYLKEWLDKRDESARTMSCGTATWISDELAKQEKGAD